MKPISPQLILIIIAFFSLIAILGVTIFLLKNPKSIQPSELIQPPFAPQVNKIEIFSDAKSILNAETKKVIFTIADTKQYLKSYGYEYNPDTFQTTNAKYEGDCFLSAALSNKKDRIVFSTGCLPGDLPQAWVGVYFFSTKMQFEADSQRIDTIPSFIRFLIGGSGRNFVWSADDKTITYEATLGLSGMTETRTIDSRTGEILEIKSQAPVVKSETAGWNIYRNDKYSYEIKYPNDWQMNDEDGAIVTFFDKKYKTAGEALDNKKVIQTRVIDRKDGTDYWEKFKQKNNPELKKINGIDFYFLKTSMASLSFYEYYAYHDGKIFTIALFVISELPQGAKSESDIKYPTEAELSNELNILNRMLSTFEFVERKAN